MKKLFTLLLSLSVATMLKAQAENLYYIVTDYTNNEVSVSWCEPPIEGTLEIPAYVILQNGAHPELRLTHVRPVSRLLLLRISHTLL